MQSIGIDIGSTTVKVVLLLDGRVAYSSYEKSLGEPVKCLLNRLNNLQKNHPQHNGITVGITGSGAEFVSTLNERVRVNEVIALFKAHVWGYQNARTVIEIGGQDSKLLFLSKTEGNGLFLSDFSLNTLCSAGTGGFLEEQAMGLGVEVSKIGEKAILSMNPAHIAGRCSVFAKSDMVHLQQVGVSIEDILFGLCLTLAKNFRATLGKGKTFESPVFFEGGVAANPGMVKAFKHILGEERPITIPPHFNIMAAIGAAVYATEIYFTDSSFVSLSNLIAHLNKLATKLNDLPFKEKLLRPKYTNCQVGNNGPLLSVSNGISIKGGLFMGVDVGSVSTNIALIDATGKPKYTIYKRTRGNSISCVLAGMKEMAFRLGFPSILGVGVTGSGRYLIGECIGADVVKTEITAQARAALELVLGVDTIFEIGGQDSKFIRFDNGRIVEFEMNRACAAGTGSFLEEISSKMGIDIELFDDIAFSANMPCAFGERCAVFIESDVVAYQQKGARKEDLLAGLAYSIADNYINKVVGRRKLGECIVFLGGVAKNAAVVSALSRKVKKKILVPEFADVSGAIGAALLAKDLGPKKTNFCGFLLDESKINIKSFRCHKCENMCQIQTIKTKNRSRVFLGSRCDRYTKRTNQRGAVNFMNRRQELLQKWNLTGTFKYRLGFPCMGPYYDYWPFFSKMFECLDIELVNSAPTSFKTLSNSQDANIGEMCLPVQILAGHLKELEEKSVDAIFIPGICKHFISKELPCGQVCPYVKAMPYLAHAFWSNLKKPIVPSLVNFGGGIEGLMESFVRVKKKFGIVDSLMKEAVCEGMDALRLFKKDLKWIGYKLLQNREHSGIVVVGRPYNTLDPFISMSIADKITSLGYDAIPMDCLNLEAYYLNNNYNNNMYWYAGQQIIAAASRIKLVSNMHALYYTNFGCGPDNFIIHFFEKEIYPKPFLVLEVDEHSADAGILTRLQAFTEGLSQL